MPPDERERVPVLPSSGETAGVPGRQIGCLFTLLGQEACRKDCKTEKG